MRSFVGIALLALSCTAWAAPPVQLWSTATATKPSDGWALVYRFADRLSPELKKSSQPERVTIIWRYKGSGGLPITPERESMDALEDAIDGRVPNEGTLVLVSTGNNQRRWVYYTRSADSFVEAIQRVYSESSRTSLEFETAADPEWSLYDAFVRSIRR